MVLCDCEERNIGGVMYWWISPRIRQREWRRKRRRQNEGRSGPSTLAPGATTCAKVGASARFHRPRRLAVAPVDVVAWAHQIRRYLFVLLDGAFEELNSSWDATFKPPLVSLAPGSRCSTSTPIEGMHGRLFSPAPRHGECMGIVVALLGGN